jgi:malate/lactate dehydrogenase
VKISIIGAAGTLGSCTAFALAYQGLADELVMFDLNKNLLKCHLMDISAAVSGIQDTEIREGNTDLDLKNSDLVIFTASVPYRFITNRLEFLFDNLKIVAETARKIKKYCPRAVVINATNPIDPLNYAMYLCINSDRRNFLGYSLNDSIRFRMMAARALGVSAAAVEGVVLGEHGENQVPIFSALKLRGNPVSVDDAFKSNIRTDMANVLSAFENLRTGRTSGWTSAVGISSIVKAIYHNTQEIFPCSAILAGEYGAKEISIGVPVSLNRNGVGKIIEWQLDPDELHRMQKAISMQQDIVRKVAEVLKK